MANFLKRSRPWPVLLMSRSLGPGGSERQLAEYAKALNRSDFLPHVACSEASGYRFEELRARGVPILEMPMRSFLSRDCLKAACQLRRYLGQHEICLVHPFDHTLNIFGVPLARGFRTPVVLSSQRGFTEVVPERYRLPMRISHHLAHGVIVNCEALRRHVVADLGVWPGKVQVCYNGLDTAVFHPLPRARPPALRDASLVLGVVCVLRPEKGLPTLLEAFARLQGLQPGMRLVLVGSGPERSSLDKQVEALHLQDTCLLEPSTPDIAGWLRAIDIFVLPSLSEALSNSLMEAMACGCCAVASRVGGNPELISHRETGLLFDPASTADLAEQLRSVIQNPVLRQDLARAGAQRMARSFSIAAAVDRLQEVYASFLVNKALR